MAPLGHSDPFLGRRVNGSTLFVMKHSSVYCLNEGLAPLIDLMAREAKHFATIVTKLLYGDLIEIKIVEKFKRYIVRTNNHILLFVPIPGFPGSTQSFDQNQ